jgi:hypothetical protein
MSDARITVNHRDLPRRQATHVGAMSCEMVKTRLKLLSPIFCHVYQYFVTSWQQYPLRKKLQALSQVRCSWRPGYY